MLVVALGGGCGPRLLSCSRHRTSRPQVDVTLRMDHERERKRERGRHQWIQLHTHSAQTSNAFQHGPECRGGEEERRKSPTLAAGARVTGPHEAERRLREASEGAGACINAARRKSTRLRQLPEPRFPACLLIKPHLHAHRTTASGCFFVCCGLFINKNKLQEENNSKWDSQAYVRLLNVHKYISPYIFKIHLLHKYVLA